MRRPKAKKGCISKRHAISRPSRYSGPDRGSSGYDSPAYIMPDQEIRRDNQEDPSWP